jgi:hypothetical protein
MDSDEEEVIAALMDEEVVVTATAREDVGDEEHLSIFVAFLAIIIEEDKPRLGGFVSGRRKSKPRERMEGYCMLYDDYFADVLCMTMSFSVAVSG